MEWEWSWHPHPDVWALVIALGALYWVAAKRLGPSLVPAGERPVTRSQAVWFSAGLLTILVASDYPIHDLSEGALYSMHMTQHMLLSFVAPPLILLGTPAWLARWVLTKTGTLGLVRRLSRPIAALVLFNAVTVLTHWPVLVNASIGNELMHFSVHALVVLSAFVMWMPVVSPLLEVPRFSYPGQMGFLFLQSLVPTVPASFLTFGETPLYAAYEALPKLWGLTALEDQRLAGLIMKIGGGFYLWGIITVLFFKWYAVEERSGADVLAYRDLDRQLKRSELAKP